MPGLGKSQGGPSYSVPRLCSAIQAAGHATRLATVDDPDDPPFEGVEASFSVPDYTQIPVLRNLRASRALKHSIANIIQQTSLVHAHGLWLMPNVYAGKAARKAKKPLIVTSRGMLSEEALEISKLKKQVFWNLLQKTAYADASVWHATSDAEADEIRRFGITSPIAIIPNGVDIPAAPTSPDLPNTSGEPKTVLFLSRIHPKKGLANLIEAWATLEHTHPDWRLRIIGPDEAGEAERIRLLANHHSLQSVTVEDPVFGSKKWDVLSDAEVFVLPTKSENFGIAVAEALAAGTPAIVTKRAPWAGLHHENCGWWIDYGVEPLASALSGAMALSCSERQQMGKKGRDWIQREFSWDKIAASMIDVYGWLNSGAPIPDTVHA